MSACFAAAGAAARAIAATTTTTQNLVYQEREEEKNANSELQKATTFARSAVKPDKIFAIDGRHRHGFQSRRKTKCKQKNQKCNKIISKRTKFSSAEV